MSRAFIKEDTEEPERFARKPSATGLPPGALNYMTAAGAERLRRLLPNDEIQSALESASILPPRDEKPTEILFGTTATLKRTDGTLIHHRIVGVDECHLEPEWISWISPLARVLIGAKPGDRVHLPDDPAGEKVEVVQIEN